MKETNNPADDEVAETFQKLKYELNKAIIEGNDAISYLIVINELWWERFNKHVITDVPKSISQKTRQNARGLFIFLELEKINDENEWMRRMAYLTNDYREQAEVEEEQDELGDPYGWRPLDLE